MEALKPANLFDKADTIWQRAPFEHQTDMARFHYDNPCSGDGSDVGVGKTPAMIAVIRRLIARKQVARCLVICPNTILDNWANEIQNWSTLSWVILRGPKDKRIALLQQSKLVDVYLINYEGVRVIFPQLAAANFDMIVCDEVHHIKSPRAEQTKLILKLAKDVRYRKGMTGTLLTNDIEDLWAVCQFIEPKIFKMNYWGFRNSYMMNKNAGLPWLKFPNWVAKPGAAEEIKKIIEPYFIRFEKREVLKFLPPVLFQRRSVTLSDEQRRVYNQLKRDYVVELDNNEDLAALHVLSRVTKLLEITSGFAYVDREKIHHPGWQTQAVSGQLAYRFSGNTKLSELRDVLEEIGEQRVVIWASFREDCALIAQVLIEIAGAESFAMITGNTRQEERQPIVDRFNKDELRYLICNASCAGEGLSIYAPYAVYYSRSWKLGERLQSLGRHDRPGAEQFDNVTIIDLVAADSVDEEVMKALESKTDLLETINPESFRRMLR